MTSRSRTATAVVGGVLAVSLAAFGCSSGNPSDKLIGDSNKTNIRRLANLYMMYQAFNGWGGPKDEAAFKAFIAKADPATLKPMGVDPDALDPLFQSERDKKPFKIRYGVKGGPHGSSPVVFEEGTGAGSREVGFTGMVVKAVDAAEYDQLWKGVVPNEPKPAAATGAAVPGGPPAAVLNQSVGGGPPAAGKK